MASDRDMDQEGAERHGEVDRTRNCKPRMLPAINPGTETVGSEENDADQCSVGGLPGCSPRREFGAQHLESHLFCWSPTFGGPQIFSGFAVDFQELENVAFR